MTNKLCLIIGLLSLNLFLTKIIPIRLFYNHSPSMPIGWYIGILTVPTQIKHGDLVISCLPSRALTHLALARHYLAPAHHACPEHSSYIIKQVAAIGGDLLQIEKHRLRVNQQAIANSTILDYDSQHLPLASWLTAGIIAPGFYLLLGHHPHSFDSRYFGLVPEHRIVGKAFPLWVSQELN